MMKASYRNLSIDLETYSPVNLKKSGVACYVEHPDFAILLIGYAFDGGEVHVVDVAKVRAAIKAAYEEGKVKLQGNSKSVPALETLKTPLRDGDLERPDDPDYAGCYFINANSIQPVGIVDRDCNPILDHSEVYSGIRGRISLTFYAFNTSTARGIAASLNNVQKWSDGPALGGKSSPEEDFQDGEDDEGFLS